jgi:hypothetical protein
VNYSLKVVELVSLLLIVNYVLDFMNVCDIVLCMIYHVYSICFGGSPFGEAAKIVSDKKFLYSSVKGHMSVVGRLWDPIYSSINR